MQILGKCNSTSKLKIFIKVSDKVVNVKKYNGRRIYEIIVLVV